MSSKSPADKKNAVKSKTSMPKSRTIPIPLRGGPLYGLPKPLPQLRTSPAPAVPKTRSKVPYVVGGIAVYALTSYSVYLYLQYSKAVKINKEHQILHNRVRHEDVDVSQVYEKISAQYDSLVEDSEFFMGMPLLRKSIARRLKGDVLEVSAGTGRNIKYLPVDQCKSITMVDSSPNMLAQARKYFREKYPEYKSITFLAQDAAEPILSPSNAGFDFIFQTMGLCSTDTPVKLLRNLESHCKDDGKIILMEHGRSHYDWLNNILDAFAPEHAENWGCWWNKDIGKIVEESGLTVDKITRYHFGTTWKIEASRSKPREPTLVSMIDRKNGASEA